MLSYIVPKKDKPFKNEIIGSKVKKNNPFLKLNLAVKL